MTLGKIEEEARERRKNGCTHTRHALGTKLAGHAAPRGQGEWTTGGQMHGDGTATITCTRCAYQWRFLPNHTEREYTQDSGLLGAAPPPARKNRLGRISYMTTKNRDRQREVAYCVNYFLANSDLGLTQREFASAVDVTEDHLSEFLRGSRELTDTARSVPSHREIVLALTSARTSQNPSALPESAVALVFSLRLTHYPPCLWIGGYFRGSLKVVSIRTLLTCTHTKAKAAILSQFRIVKIPALSSGTRNT
jgi:hypothetical protein